ncbi:MAG: hypothetical protein LUP91_07105, partial [Methylococcaceae bacterium]|nr:hypothetical protein [Methylococcaceae bacterium]
FNTLKNGGYGMEHQYARKSYTALKNYFQFMQMAHIIHQLMTPSCNGLNWMSRSWNVLIVNVDSFGLPLNE